MFKCPFCNFKTEESDIFESHLLEDHFITISDYYEMIFPEVEDDRCYKCGKPKNPLTYIEPGTYFMPCWDCMTNRYEKTQSLAMIQSAIKDYYTKISTDRFLQMFLIGDVYFNSTATHTYEEFKGVLKSLQRTNKIDRNKIWFLDWIPGFPKTICQDNLSGIKVVLIDDRYDVISEKDKIRINSWIIKLPDFVPFDQRHHSRYNLLNISVDSRNTKRLRLKNEDKCIRFQNNGESPFKSLLKLENLDGTPLSPLDLSEQDLTVTKLILLRNKNFMRLIVSFLDEIVKSVGIISDSVFLRNTITINPGKEDIKLNFSWLPKEEKLRKNYINVSIL